MKLEREEMSKITICNKDYHMYVDKRAKEAMKRYSCDPHDLLGPLADVEFNEPQDTKNITVEIKIDKTIRGSFIIQPTLIESQKWFILTFTNIVDIPAKVSDTKYIIKLSCGHNIVSDTTVDNITNTPYYECNMCKNSQRKRD